MKMRAVSNSQARQKARGGGVSFLIALRYNC
ncbi:hypothetical protein J2X16_004853 [Pelomonas aquatica]|uniref:Uncharacterized protein n=1 Tax=Pelomonas aquatica TaxID=431058 RepID=A0ABU1ZG93_9BURK|nr:hypothetical protein [Pelomonas aquatica]